MKFCQERQIQLVAYSPLGSPRRLWALPSETQLLEDNTLRIIAQKYDKTTAQILLRWQVCIFIVIKIKKYFVTPYIDIDIIYYVTDFST